MSTQSKPNSSKSGKKTRYAVVGLGHICTSRRSAGLPECHEFGVGGNRFRRFGKAGEAGEEVPPRSSLFLRGIR